MKTWLVKQEPDSYSFAQFSKEKTTAWTGVRNFQARNFLKEMAKGDEVFYYHSGDDKAVVGTATVQKAAYPDPTVEADEKGDWVCVDLKAGQPVPRPVPLKEIKAQPGLKKFLLVTHSRLSVMPVGDAEAKILRKLAGL